MTAALQEIDQRTQAANEAPAEEAPSELRPGARCPQCGGILVLRSSERGEFLGCSNYPACSFVRHLPAAAVATLLTLPDKCPQCGSPLAVKRGRFGIFIGCENYPQCRFRVQEHRPTAFTCPQCRKGELVKRQSRQGRTFYGCSNYPACDLIVPGEPVMSPCPDCGFPLRCKKKVKAGIALYCPNPLCASRRRRKKDLLQAG